MSKGVGILIFGLLAIVMIIGVLNAREISLWLAGTSSLSANDSECVNGPIGSIRCPRD